MTSSALWHLKDTVSSSTPWFLVHRIFPTLLLQCSPKLWGTILDLGLNSQKLLNVLWIVIFVDYCPMQKEDFLMNAWKLTNSYQGNCIKGSLILSSFRKPKIVYCLLAPMTSATKDSWSDLQYKSGVLAYRLAWNPIRKPLCTSGIIFQVEYHCTNSVHSWVILLITFLLLSCKSPSRTIQANRNEASMSVGVWDFYVMWLKCVVYSTTSSHPKKMLLKEI